MGDALATTRLGWAILAVCLLSPTALRADIAPDPPRNTYWKRDEAPNPAHLILAGSLISAAMVSAGLIVVWRRGPRLFAGSAAMGVVVVAVLAIGAGTTLLWQKTQSDRAAWEKYDEVRKNWRGGRGRPIFEEQEKRELEAEKKREFDRKPAAPPTGDEGAVPLEAPPPSGR